MASPTASTVAAVFAEPEDARQAVRALRDAGFNDAEIGVARSRLDETSGSTLAGTDDTAMASGAVAGAATGAGLGALWGLGILAGFLPAIGPAIAGGTLAAILSSAAAGAAAAGLAGALLGMGFSTDEAEYYDNEMKSGRTVVTVAAGGRRDEVMRLLRNFRGYNFDDRKAVTATTNTDTSATTRQTTAQHHTHTPIEIGAGESTTMQAREEQLRVCKEPVEQGEVKIRKEVHTEHKTIDVPVTREEVVIERRPASGDQFGRDEIRIPVKEEQVRVDKETVIKEEVSIGKRMVKDSKRVGADLRKEEIHVEKEGEARIQDRR